MDQYNLSMMQLIALKSVNSENIKPTKQARPLLKRIWQHLKRQRKWELNQHVVFK
jgi:hypothetical protein